MNGERRRLQRARPVAPLRARAGEQRAFVIDLSLNGLRVAHQEPIGAVGGAVSVRFEWDGRVVEVSCVIRWSQVQNAGRAAHVKALWHSGVEIDTFVGAHSRSVLRELMTELVARALDEQRANARGVPATAAQSLQTGAAKGLTRHEKLAGTWRASATNDTRQPPNGFTVSADHPDSEVAMLREAYDTADADGRNMIRKLAELSISTAEGIPTRRYEP